MIKGVLLIIAIIVFAILTILSFIFSIIYLVNSKKGKFIWLGGFVFSLVALITSAFLLANSIANKVTSLTENFEKSFTNMDKNMLEQMDSSKFNSYNLSDSTNNKQVILLKLFESESKNNNVPQQFYTYLGFGDYYRLPIKYPFSFHCADSLNNATLFNETEVVKFDQSNNGEKDCGINNVSEFVYDRNFLLATRKYSENSKLICSYLIYNFETETLEEFESLNKMIKRANELKFSKPYKFTDCKKYFDGFYEK